MPPRRAKSFDPKTLVVPADSAIGLQKYRAKEDIFLQGNRADALYYIADGKVTMSVRSKQGKTCVLAIFKSGDFFGVGCVAGRPLRMATATALTACSLVRFEKRAMSQLLRNRPEFSRCFMADLLSRIILYQEELVDCLFNSSEKRLARILLSLAHFEKKGATGLIVPKISQQTLCQMVGTTRARVSHFMNKFRRLGFVDYNGELIIQKSLRRILHDVPPGTP
jgi:CRP/FNR family cyclic AMP-dependent transcriptional regulator